MALIVCPECLRQVSESAVSCPNCGYPIAPQQAAQPQEGIFLQTMNVGCVAVLTIAGIGLVALILMFLGGPAK